MTAARDLYNLGPATEARIAAAFAAGVTITAEACSKLLGVNPKALREMTDAGLIRAVRRGKVRGYIEIDVRTYLAESPDACRRSVRRETAPGRKVIPFSARRDARRERL